MFLHNSHAGWQKARETRVLWLRSRSKERRTMTRFVIKSTEPSLGQGHIRFLSAPSNENRKNYIDAVEYWEGVVFFDISPLLCSTISSSTFGEPWEYQPLRVLQQLCMMTSERNPLHTPFKIHAWSQTIMR